MRFAVLVVALAAAVTQARAAAIDFASHAGMEATCASLQRKTSASLARDRDRVAFAICESLAPAKGVATCATSTGPTCTGRHLYGVD